ncbi:MAG: DNA polymerase/3'-5' exonuclease PolX [Armatimonadota bacterium]
MKNQRIARIFENMADLLEIEGGETFRIRAYRRASAEIDALAENLEEIARRGQLEEIPGIGESIAAKIQDILATDTTPAYEELKSRVPEGLLDMLQIPEVGPRTVATIYEKFGITTIDELESAAKKRKLRGEIGTKQELAILKGIEMLRRKSGRLALGIVLPMAEEVMARIRRAHGVKRISEAGSLRRRSDTIGDIDLVVQTDDPARAARIFTHLPQVREVIETGPSMSSVWTTMGLRMDLRMAGTENYGAMLHHFTGGKQHNIHLRGMAKELGLTINEYGVFRGDERVASETEDAIYAALGLPWIPPELREDRGEIEAAARGDLPDLVEQSDLRGDLHMHTLASDGRNSVEEMAATAEGLGYEYLAITDHSESLVVAHGLSEERLRKQVNEIRSLQSRIRVLAGVEVDICADGSLDLARETLESLDIVVASVHQHQQQDPETLTRRIVAAIETGMVDILAHPLGRIIGHRDPLEYDIERVMDAARAHGTALEINSYPDRLDLPAAYARAAAERGILLAVNTDAHNPGDFANVRFGVATARRGWLTAENVLNTRSLPELVDWLQARRPRKELRARTQNSSA